MEDVRPEERPAPLLITLDEAAEKLGVLPDPEVRLCSSIAMCDHELSGAEARFQFLPAATRAAITGILNSYFQSCVSGWN